MVSIEFGILFPAFLAGMLVLATHVPLGQQVLARGIVFIDLAIAQVAGLGVTAADAVGFEPQGWRVQVAAGAAALLGALALTWTEKKWPEVQEAFFPKVNAVAFGSVEAERAAELYRKVKRPRGREADLAIAACALAHGAHLWVLNRNDFQDIRDLRLL